MPRGVPAIGRDVRAATERDMIVDDEHFLMVTGAHGYAGVEQEPHGRTLETRLGAVRKEALGGGYRQGGFPAQNADIQARTLPRQRLEKRTDPIARGAPAAGLRIEAGFRIESPVQQVNGARGPKHHGLGRGQIVLHVDQEGGAISPFDPPARRPGL